ncbi:MAG: glutamine--tRNA ligase/YqeY domain fusion protein [Flavobacteriaceae bacterium]|nr:glutamine--tRNA ligase/YqeY domain fusion protein [Flavobacteriaceae bacterium]
MEKSLNFIEQVINEDLNKDYSPSSLRFRFPPEPNGFLHIGHVKAICLNFNLGEQYNAPVNLRFDDTNPAKEETEYVEAIKKDILWLGYQWTIECYASDYFDQLYEWAHDLIDKGLAYIDSQTSEEIASQKGTPTQAGKESPYRKRTIVENKALFTDMKEGKFKEGAHVLRAKIDMSSPNMLLRDPIMYRILFKEHHRTGKNWCIYPMYDWTHGESDYIEQISHSLCTLEFKPHRDLYDWFLQALQPHALPLVPKQREFARLNLSYTVTSKRKLASLIEKGLVSGWDDPRMPTISGLRRRGYTPAALRKFVEVAGVSKRENVIDLSLLEFCVREDLNQNAPRVNAILNPVSLVITNYPEDQTETLFGEINPEKPDLGTREIPFSKRLYIEREDFKEEANRKFFRLTIGKEVRLKNAYIIKGEHVEKDDAGNITTIYCTYDPESKSGSGTEASQRKVKGTLHWLSQAQALPVKVNLYDRLFKVPAPDQDKEISFLEHINPDSYKQIDAFVEPSVKGAKPGSLYQFQRMGYFAVDQDSRPEELLFNKTVGLRDTWAKQQTTQ